MITGKHQIDTAKPVDWLKLSEQLREFRARSRCGLSEVARLTGIPVQQLAWLEGGLIRPLESAAVLVHDLSNLLQAFKLSLGNAKANLSHQDKSERENQKGPSSSPHGSLRKDLQQLETISDNIDAMLGGFRRLIMQGETLATPVCMRRLIEALEPIALHEAKTQAIDLAVTNQTHPTTQVEADEVMLYRILMNFLLNSMQALEGQVSQPPRVSLVVSEEQDAQDQRTVLIRIEDNGPGYPKEILNNVGDAFDSDKQNGLGLGLLLSKNLVELWGGSVTLSNRNPGAIGQIRLRATRASTTYSS